MCVLLRGGGRRGRGVVVGNAAARAGLVTVIIVTTLGVTRIIVGLLGPGLGLGLDRGEGDGVQLWIVEVVLVGGDALLGVAGRVLAAELQLLAVHGVLLPALLLGLQRRRVTRDVRVAEEKIIIGIIKFAAAVSWCVLYVPGVRGVARADRGHGHGDLGPGGAHRQAVHGVVVVRVARLAGGN